MSDDELHEGIGKDANTWDVYYQQHVKKKRDWFRAARRLLDPEWLAATLACYEMDEPHYDEAKAYYAAITPARIAEHLASDHCGDCTGQPCPCARCAAEEWQFKAAWLIEQAGVKEDEK